MTNETNIWGIHAGKYANTSTPFLKNLCIAIDWDQMGYLPTLGPDRDIFKARTTNM